MLPKEFFPGHLNYLKVALKLKEIVKRVCLKECPKELNHPTKQDKTKQDTLRNPWQAYNFCKESLRDKTAT
jgi:hypothetical protein